MKRLVARRGAPESIMSDLANVTEIRAKGLSEEAVRLRGSIEIL